MDDLQAAVLSQLNIGKSRALKGSIIANRLGFKSDREIRLKIRQLIASGIPIAASVTPPHGYFIIETKEEAEEYMAGLRGRLIEDAFRRRDFKNASRRIRVPEQLKLIKT